MERNSSDWRHKEIVELKVVVLLNRRGKSEGGRGGQAARGGVGMEVFRGLPAD